MKGHNTYEISVKHTEIGSGNSSSGTSRNVNAKEVSTAQQSEVWPQEGLSPCLLSDIRESAATGPRWFPSPFQAQPLRWSSSPHWMLFRSLGNALQSVP